MALLESSLTFNLKILGSRQVSEPPNTHSFYIYIYTHFCLNFVSPVQQPVLLVATTQSLLEIKMENTGNRGIEGKAVSFSTFLKYSESITNI